MDGVTILNTTYISGNYNILWIIVGTIFIVVALGAVIFGVITVLEMFDNMGWLIIFGGAFLMIVGLGLFLPHIEDETTIKQKVIVEDEVKFNDFMEMYEVIGQDGKIWIVKERKEQ